MIKAYAMARTVANDPLQKFKFRITIPGLPSGMGFQKIAGLSREVGVVSYDEGGYDHTHKLTGKEKVPELVCDVGMYANKDLENLYKQALSNPDMRQTVIIELLDKFKNVARSWTLAETWVSKWEGSDLDATSEDVAIERITIQFEHYLD